MTFKNYCFIGLGLVLILFFKPSGCGATPVDEDDSRLTVWWIGGPVTAYHDERDETARLRIAESVDEGDNVLTGAKSEALLRLPGKACIFLGPHTKIHISRLRSGDKNLQIRLNLLTGDLWCQLDRSPQNMTFEVSMQSLICRCHGTLFEAIRQKDAVRLNAYNGPVVTVSRGEVKMAKTGEITQYIQDKFSYKHRLKNSDDDHLAQWKAHLADILAKTPVNNSHY
ncbi:MAG TPA: FecR domain-containing protein [bacterium]|nr:FecR domain-containing protein [bacterium]